VAPALATPVVGHALEADVTTLSRLDNLPNELSTFIGRETQIASCLELLSRSRMVTLTGPGGVGKTRLALRVAADARRDYRDGACLVELAALADPTLVPLAITNALRLRERQHETILESVVRALRPRRLLIVLDNCEHLVQPCAELAEAILHAAPLVRILATSREPLHSPGEAVWPVPPLTLPEAGTPLERANDSEATHLFLERGRAAAPRLQLTSENFDSVIQIVRQLDGVPLALELAAARLKALGIQQVAARLEDRLGLLVGGARTAMPRQQTLRAAIDWSYGLLDEREQRMFEELSVFSGGWTLEAAEAVCASTSTPAGEVLGVLEGLIDKSLVVAEDSAGKVRYRMLEILRQFARERREQRPDDSRVQRRHLEWALGEGQRIRDEDLSPSAIAGVERDQENIRAALRWSIASGALADGVRLAIAAAPMWNFRGHYTEGRAWFGALFAAVPVEARMQVPLLGRALKWDGILAFGQGDLTTAESQIVEGRALARMRGDPPDAPVVAELLANIRAAHGQLEEAQQLFREAREQYRTLKLGFWEAVALSYLANNLIELGDVDGARRAAEECLELGKGADYGFATSRALRVLGRLAAQAGSYERAAELLDEALSQQDRIGDAMGAIHTLRYQALIALDRNDPSSAATRLMRALALAGGTADHLALASCLEATAGVLCALRPDEAAQLLGAARKLRRPAGAPAWPIAQAYVDRWSERLRRTLGEGSFTEQLAAGELLTADAAAEAAREWAATYTTTTLLAAPTPADQLTAHQQAIAILIVRGCTNEQIALQLNSSVAAVRAQIEHIRDRLGLHSRAQIAAWAVANRVDDQR
jgi:non-specific serine/threonine protein kinase